MQPAISFVIPVYNETRFIEDCLSSIARVMQPLDAAFEMVVVDNGSTDRTAEIARSLGANVVTIERSSVSEARNVGVEAAKAPLIAFIDADVVVTPEWASAAAGLLEGGYDPLLVTGYQYVVRDDASWIEDTWFRHIKDRYLNGGNIVVTRAAFEKAGGFDPAMKTGEDYDFCTRLIDSGATYAPDAAFRAIHMGYPRDLTNFTRREIWHGEGDFRSWGTFLASPVALISMAYIGAQIGALVLFGLGFWTLGAAALGMVVFVNLALTVYRFRPKSLRRFLWNNVAHYVYFMARGMSLVRALRNRRKPY